MLQIYYMDVSAGCTYVEAQAFDEIIVDERKEKIMRQRNASSANKQRLISVFLQCCLAKALGISVKEVRFDYGPHGKPMLIGSEYDFNLSHSGKYVVLAISDANIGVDVEGKKKDRLHIAKRFFCEKEYQEIMDYEDSRDREVRFVELWTMKEAYVKWMGTGLQTGFDSFLIEKEEDEISKTVLQNGETVWYYTHFLGEDSFCVSVCSEREEEIKDLKRDVFCEVNMEFLKEMISNS